MDKQIFGCGPGEKLAAPTPNERIPDSEHLRRIQRGLQLAADSMAALAARREIAEGMKSLQK